MERHLVILSILVRLWGGLSMLVGISLLLLSAGALAILSDPNATAIAFASGLTAAMFATLGLSALCWGAAHVWSGVRLVRRDGRARALTLALALVNLLILPFGTALGSYAFWVLLTDDARRLFHTTPVAADL